MIMIIVNLSHDYCEPQSVVSLSAPYLGVHAFPQNDHDYFETRLPHETETETGYLGKLISDIFQTIDRGTIPEMESGTALKALS